MLSPERDPRQPAPSRVAGTFGAALTPAEWVALAKLGHAQRYPARATLMYQGEPGDRVMVLLTGRVKVVVVSPDGHEQLLSIRDPGDVLGELSFLDLQPRSGSVVALEPVEVLGVPAPVFREFLESAPRVAVALLESLTRRFRDTTAKRAQFGALDTLGRLAARLVELADRYGGHCEGGIEIRISLTQEELGSWTGASPAGVAKALQTMRELGWIATQRRQIVIRDIEAVRRRCV
jgi:CRP/FNR family cyclic AMP-dependent transcriptional regulator